MQLALQTTIIVLEHTSTFKIFTALTSYARCVEKEKKEPPAKAIASYAFT